MVRCSPFSASEAITKHWLGTKTVRTGAGVRLRQPVTVQSVAQMRRTSTVERNDTIHIDKGT